jgi:hypothetical protein
VKFMKLVKGDASHKRLGTSAVVRPDLQAIVGITRRP